MPWYQNLMWPEFQYFKDLYWAGTHRWTPRNTATKAPAHPTVVQWCQKKWCWHKQILGAYDTKSIYTLHKKNKREDCYKMISSHHKKLTPERIGYIRTCLETKNFYQKYCISQNSNNYIYTVDKKIRLALKKQAVKMIFGLASGLLE